MAKNTTNKKQQKEQKDSTSVFIRGILTDAFYGVKQFAKGNSGKDKYHISIKAVPEDMEALVEAAAPYYEDAEDQWIPNWFKNEDEREYLNLSSNYDIKAGYRNPETGKIEDIGNLIEYIDKSGNINGSKVVLMVTIKEGAVYPASILVKEFKHITIADMFADFDDDLPF